MTQYEGDQNVGLTQWDYQTQVRRCDPLEVTYSRGFLRSRPERWFPGINATWLPLTHSLGVEIRLIEVKPLLTAPKGLEFSYAASVDNELVILSMDADSERTLLDTMAPGSSESGRAVVREYLARRFVSCLASSWSGPESSTVMFHPDRSEENVDVAGAVRVTIMVNGNQSQIWLLLGRYLVEKLDGLWRRQIQSSSKTSEVPVNLELEVAQLAVPPSMLVEYVKVGTVIDLEVPVSDTLTLRADNQPWMPARMCDVGGNFGFETVAGPVVSGALPEGTTRLSIQLGSITLSPAELSEMSQIGAIFDSKLPMTDKIKLVVNGEVVGSGQLCSYEGRFAVSVG